jgi:hypothetical protein
MICSGNGPFFFLRGKKGVIKADEFQIASLRWQIDDSVCKHRNVI